MLEAQKAPRRLEAEALLDKAALLHEAGKVEVASRLYQRCGSPCTRVPMHAGPAHGSSTPLPSISTAPASAAGHTALCP